MGGIMSLTGDVGRTPLVTGGNQAQVLAGLNAFARGGHVLVRPATATAVASSSTCRPRSARPGMLELYGRVHRGWWAGHPAPRQPHPSHVGRSTRASTVGPASSPSNARSPRCSACSMTPSWPSHGSPSRCSACEPLNEEALTAKMYVCFMDKTKAELLAAGLAAMVPVGVAMTPGRSLATPGLHERGAFDTHRRRAPCPVAPVPRFRLAPVGRAAGRRPVGAALGRHRPVGSRHAPARRASGRRPHHDVGGSVRHTCTWPRWAPTSSRSSRRRRGTTSARSCPSPASPTRGTRRTTSTPTTATSGRSRSTWPRPRAATLLLRLLANADVLIENYRADVLDKLGLTDDVLQAANPKLGHHQHGGVRQSGPRPPLRRLRAGDRADVGPRVAVAATRRRRAVQDRHLLRRPSRRAERRAPPSCSASSARRHRRTGCHVDLAQRETAWCSSARRSSPRPVARSPVHRGCRDARFAPQGAYRVPGDEQWLVVSVRTDDEWRALCVCHRPRRSRPASPSTSDAPATTSSTAIEAWSEMQRAADRHGHAAGGRGAGGPGARHRLDARRHPHLHRGYWVYLPTRRCPATGSKASPGVCATPRPNRRHAPFFGEHNEEILAALGVSQEELAELSAANVIATAPINPGVG